MAMRHHFARMADQHGEQAVFRRRQVHLLAGHEHLARGEIHAPVAACVVRWLVHRSVRSMPQRDAQPGQQLADAKGLGQVVVGSSVQRGNLVALLIASGEHDNRDLAPVA
ncbi:hypothetical protein D3C87_1897360 [compost metagenome]